MTAQIAMDLSTEELFSQLRDRIHDLRKENHEFGRAIHSDLAVILLNEIQRREEARRVRNEDGRM